MVTLLCNHRLLNNSLHGDIIFSFDNCSLIATTFNNNMSQHLMALTLYIHTTLTIYNHFNGFDPTIKAVLIHNIGIYTIVYFSYGYNYSSLTRAKEVIYHHK
jgi:hypothetical protein